MSKTITTPAAKTDPSSSKRRYAVVGTGGRSWRVKMPPAACGLAMVGGGTRLVAPGILGTLMLLSLLYNELTAPTIEFKELAALLAELD